MGMGGEKSLMIGPALIHIIQTVVFQKGKTE